MSALRGTNLLPTELSVFVTWLLILAFLNACPGRSDEVSSQGGARCETETNASEPFFGYNMEGESESCMEMGSEVPCTPEFTADDNFGMRCMDAGFETVQCECHHWVCAVKPNELP